MVSALSLDFFLTQPYLHLAIADKHDLIASLGLAGCGLLRGDVRFVARARARELKRR